MKKILFPTDFSPVARNAFIHALEFANTVKAEIVLLHTFDVPSYDSSFFPPNYTILYNSVELSKFEQFKDEVPKLRAIAEKLNLQHITLSHRLTEGDLTSCIFDIIQDEDIDFVVMGTNGVQGWDDFFTGTNTANTISSGSVPVLCIPGDALYRPIHQICFTTRFRKKDKKALKQVLAIARKTRAKVKCLYVKTSSSDVTKDTIKAWEDEFSADPVEFHVMISDDVQGSIYDFIQQKDIDILTLLHYKRSFLVGIFNSSLTRKMANYTDIPILAIPAEVE